ERLAFPAGVATAETMTQIHGRGGDAAARLVVLAGGAVLAGAVKLAGEIVGGLPRLALPLALPLPAALRGGGAPTLANLGFGLDPSLLMIGFGAVIGLRAGLSLLAGALVAWLVLGPLALAQGWAEPGSADPGAAW